MRDTMMHILIFLYGTAGLVGFLAYIPTIRDLYQYKKQSANTTSYVMWITTTGISSLYGTFILEDTLFVLISSASFIACTTILGLTLLISKRH